MIADTGHGLSPEAKEKLFLPYFSTKGRGTGLGLAIVREIVNAQGGTIRCESQPGKGTTFYLMLPVWADTPVPQEKSLFNSAGA